MRELSAANEVIVLTGVTGGLGSELLPRLLKAFPHHSIVALARADSDHSAAQRVLESLDYADVQAEERTRVVPLRADIARPRLGLADAQWQALVERAGRAFHLAASVDFDLSLEGSRRVNVDSTRELLGLARACIQQGREDFRLDYVSTSFVVGRRRGPLLESELDVGQSYWNGYEQSKLEAEVLIAEAGDVPSTVYRPSQIIGESQHGRIRKFFGYYEFLKLAARARMPVLVADPQARPDMVPTDYVCDAITHLSQRADSIGRTFHLTAGLKNSISFEQSFAIIFEQIERVTGVPVVIPRLYRPDRLESDASAGELKRYHLSPLKILLRTYLPYVSYERDFVCDQTQMMLADGGVVLPDMREALTRTTCFALQHRYGAGTASTITDTMAPVAA